MHLYVLEQSPGWWTVTDLTATTGMASPAGAPMIFQRGGDPYVVYRGEDDRAHGVFYRNGGWWVDELSASGAPACAGDPMGYNWIVPRIVYRGEDGRLHEMTPAPGGGWGHFDMSAVVGVPHPISGNPFGYASNIARVLFRANGGVRLHEVGLYSDGWGHFDYGRSDLAGDAMGYVDNTSRVVYRSTAGHTTMISLAATGWEVFDITGVPGTTRAVDDPFGHFDNAGRVTVHAPGDKLHQVWLSGSDWHDFDVSAVPGVVDVAGRPMGCRDHIVYRGQGDHVHEVAMSPNGWVHNDLSAAAGAPRVATNVYGSDAPDGVLRVVYGGEEDTAPPYPNPTTFHLRRQHETTLPWVGWVPIGAPAGAQIEAVTLLVTDSRTSLVGPAHATHPGYGGPVDLIPNEPNDGFHGQPVTGQFQLVVTGVGLQDDSSFALQVGWTAA